MPTEMVEHPTDVHKWRWLQNLVKAGGPLGFAFALSGALLAFVAGILAVPSGIISFSTPLWMVVLGISITVGAGVVESTRKRRVRSLEVPSELHQRWERVLTRYAPKQEKLSPDGYSVLAELIPMWRQLETSRRLADREYLDLDHRITREIAEYGQRLTV